jgi:putative intracellular protease/amidase
MSKTTEFQNPLSWTDQSFSMLEFDMVFLPGGHEKGVRQLIDSAIVHRNLRDFFPKTRRDEAMKKVVGAICHGVMVLSETLVDEVADPGGKSVIRECRTTALPMRFEQVAFWGTRAWLGDYYKTYGAGSESVEESVKKRLDDPGLFKVSLGMSP